MPDRPEPTVPEGAEGGGWHGVQERLRGVREPGVLLQRPIQLACHLQTLNVLPDIQDSMPQIIQLCL